MTSRRDMLNNSLRLRRTYRLDSLKRNKFFLFILGLRKKKVQNRFLIFLRSRFTKISVFLSELFLVPQSKRLFFGNHIGEHCQVFFCQNKRTLNILDMVMCMDSTPIILEKQDVTFFHHMYIDSWNSYTLTSKEYSCQTRKCCHCRCCLRCTYISLAVLCDAL